MLKDSLNLKLEKLIDDGKNTIMIDLATFVHGLTCVVALLWFLLPFPNNMATNLVAS